MFDRAHHGGIARIGISIGAEANQGIYEWLAGQRVARSTESGHAKRPEAQ
jgi:hypothetical protein